MLFVSTSFETVILRLKKDYLKIPYQRSSSVIKTKDPRYTEESKQKKPRQIRVAEAER